MLQVTKFQVEFVQQLEETLKVNFSESSKDKLYRWLAITERRRKLTDIQITKSLEMKKIYQDDHLYQLLDSLFYQHIYDNQSKDNCETIFSTVFSNLFSF